jgi:hypothetical protein
MIVHVTDQSFPFPATLTHPVGDFEVGDKVVVVGWDEEPHTYVVAKTKSAAGVGGVSPLWFEFDAQDDPNAADPTADPVHEAQEASKGDAKALDAKVRKDAEKDAEKARADQVEADRKSRAHDAEVARAAKAAEKGSK